MWEVVSIAVGHKKHKGVGDMFLWWRRALCGILSKGLSQIKCLIYSKSLLLSKSKEDCANGKTQKMCMLISNYIQIERGNNH